MLNPYQYKGHAWGLMGDRGLLVETCPAAASVGLPALYTTRREARAARHGYLVTCRPAVVKVRLCYQWFA